MADSPPSSVKSPPCAERLGIRLLRTAITGTHVGKIAVVSSFGAESALLLALVAEIDQTVPVLFLDTLKSFPETLDYRDRVTAHLGLRDVRTITPDPDDIALRDPLGGLHAFRPDECCGLRKVAPLGRALAPFDAWVNGRKRYQTADRGTLAFSETIDGKVKLNPLADWTAADIVSEFRARNLPSHKLVAHGFTSIGCAPCTRAVRAGETGRAGRWPGLAKTECGIHRPERRSASG